MPENSTSNPSDGGEERPKIRLRLKGDDTPAVAAETSATSSRTAAQEPPQAPVQVNPPSKPAPIRMQIRPRAAEEGGEDAASASPESGSAPAASTPPPLPPEASAPPSSPKAPRTAAARQEMPVAAAQNAPEQKSSSGTFFTVLAVLFVITLLGAGGTYLIYSALVSGEGDAAQEPAATSEPSTQTSAGITQAPSSSPIGKTQGAVAAHDALTAQANEVLAFGAAESVQPVAPEEPGAVAATAPAEPAAAPEAPRKIVAAQPTVVPRAATGEPAAPQEASPPGKSTSTIASPATPVTPAVAPGSSPPTGDKTAEAVRNYLQASTVSGVFGAGESGRVLLDGTVYRVGDLVQPATGLVLVRVERGQRSVVFADPRGYEYRLGY